MAVESALYPPQLNTAWPQASDMVSEGDNHIRLTKTVIKTTFPNVAGAVSATDVQLSYVTGVTSAIQAQIDSKGAIAGQTWTGTHVFPSTTTIGGLTPTIRGYLETVTSDAQAQLNARALKAGETYSGAHNFTGAAVSVPTLAPGATGNGAASVDFANALAFASALPGQSGNAGKVVTTNGASASWTDAITLSSLNGGQLAGLRNKIINGNFDVWQRGASRPVGTDTSTAYVADRWMGVRGGFVSGATVSQQPAGLTGFRYCARVQRDSGNTDTADINLEQDLETNVSIPFQGAAVTLSFYARCGANYSAASSALAVRLISGTGTDQNSLVGTFTGAANAVASTATLTTTWQRFSYTATIGADVTQLGSRFVHAPTGTAGAADYFEITGVQLEIGSVATPFEHRPYGVELALCQRYYYRFTPAAADQTLGVGHNTSTTEAVATNFFPVAMRSAPSALGQSGTAGNYSVAHAATSTVCSAVPMFSTASTDAATTTFTVASGLTAGQGSRARAVNTSAYLAWSAEL